LIEDTTRRKFSNIPFISDPLWGVVSAAVTFENRGAIMYREYLFWGVIFYLRKLTWSKSVAAPLPQSMSEYQALLVLEAVLAYEKIIPVANLLVLSWRIRVIDQYNTICLMHNRSPARFVAIT
jgi:hypothetical protein